MHAITLFKQMTPSSLLIEIAKISFAAQNLGGGGGDVRLERTPLNPSLRMVTLYES